MNKIQYIITICITLIVTSLFYYSTYKERYTNQSYILPRTIWAYWDDPNPPQFIKENIESWRDQLSQSWKINVLNRNDIKRILPANVSSLNTQHQSDWLRLYLLKSHGGLWMDSGIIVNHPSELNALHQASTLTQSQWTGFKLGEKLENWFIMAPKGSPVIADWFDEYNKAITLGFKEYRRHIEAQGIKTDDLFAHADDVYLTQHACLRVVLGRYKTKPNMITKDASADMFRIHFECDWNRDCIQKRIADPSSKRIPYIKLRGVDR